MVAGLGVGGAASGAALQGEATEAALGTAEGVPAPVVAEVRRLQRQPARGHKEWFVGDMRKTAQSGV